MNFFIKVYESDNRHLKSPLYFFVGTVSKLVTPDSYTGMGKLIKERTGWNVLELAESRESDRK
jgi:hypothetical protein